MYFDPDTKTVVVIDNVSLVDFLKFALESGLSMQVVDSSTAVEALSTLTYELQQEYNESYEESWESSSC